MRTLYTLVITIVFCFSLFAVYNVGYERGKNKMVWENFRVQNKRDSINGVNNLRKLQFEFNYGYQRGFLDCQHLKKK